MNRRDVIKVLLGTGAVASVRAGASLPIKHGLLTVRSHLAHKQATGEDLHVFFNGQDVTEHAYEADDREGFVRLFCRDEAKHRDHMANGALHLGGDGGACRLELRGDVVIRPI